MMDSMDMASRPVQISLDTELLERIDADPEARERGRSSFIRAAVAAYLKAKERRAIDAAILSAYATDASELRAEVDDLIEAQAWPKS